MFCQSLANSVSLSKWVHVRVLFSTLAFLILTLTGQQVSAATFTVTNTGDNSLGSLRRALADANSTPANDTINFNIPLTDPNCNAIGACTITLTSGVITVQASGGNLTIANQSGAGKLLISGNNVNRVFEVTDGGNLTLDGLTVTRGVGSGTGINYLGVVSNIRGNLTIMNSIVTQNSGESIIYTYTPTFNANLNVINTTITDNIGRGIFFSNGASNGGTVNVVNSTISNNASAGIVSGGGIYFSADRLIITNSTISGNSASSGGGLNVSFSPSGSQANQLILLTNCTITNNSVRDEGGGITIFQAAVTLINCTVTGNNAQNGGGIFARGTVGLRNTIVAGNTSASGTPDFYFPFLRVCNGIATSLGNNLIGNSTNVGTSSCAFWNASDILNQSANLAPLGNNGGATQTHALLPNSPAINAGNNCVLTANGCGDNNPAIPTDQRGRNRVGMVDIGSFEFAPRTPYDFDGDGKADFAVFRPSNGTWYIMQSRDGFRAVNFGLGTDLLAPADYDGDGKTDIGVFRPSNGSWYYLRSSDNQFYGIQFGQNGDLPTPGDFDGDNKADINVYRPSDGNWYRLNSSNGQFNAVHFGISTDIPQIADFDGDGKSDITVYRESSQSFNSVFYWIESSTGTIKAHQIGSEGWIITPALADFNGDDKTDFSWFIKNRSTLYVRGIWSSPFGIETDGITKIPVPADYDGDGKAETGVFYTTNGSWFYNKVNSETIHRFNWGFGSDKPVEAAYNR